MSLSKARHPHHTPPPRQPRRDPSLQTTTGNCHHHYYPHWKKGKPRLMYFSKPIRGEAEIWSRLATCHIVYSFSCFWRKPRASWTFFRRGQGTGNSGLRSTPPMLCSTPWKQPAGPFTRPSWRDQLESGASSGPPALFQVGTLWAGPPQPETALHQHLPSQ